jgi:katanin p60 ATPase-containing subunit A1
MNSTDEEDRKKKAQQIIDNIRADERQALQGPTQPAQQAAKQQPQQQASQQPQKPEEKKTDSRASHIDPEVLKSINETILDSSPNVTWDDVKGLVEVKKVLQEQIIMPTLRPDIFRGLLAPSKGILLYGPPGNGKTLLAKAIATECKSTFFNCSASTLTSKWMGEGEKLMKALFALAADKAPSVIFIDEIDSIMGARG